VIERSSAVAGTGAGARRFRGAMTGTEEEGASSLSSLPCWEE
jgi:hypothetical protein